MDRPIVYPGAIPLDSDILTIERSVMIALGYLARSTLGTGTIADGLVVSPTSPASMQVKVSPGSMTLLTVVDQTSFGSLNANTTSPLVKLGVNISTTTMSAITAPGTSGQSQAYLLQATFAETDGTPVVLPYYNAANPAQPYSGPSNSGDAQNTIRTQTVSLQWKAGTPATTGSQTTPAADSGWFPLVVVTVANGQTTITGGNIVVAPGSPYLSANDGDGIAVGRLLNVQRFLSSGTFKPSPGATLFRVKRCVGAGGGGGGAAVDDSSHVSAGAGGGGGGWAEADLTLLQITTAGYANGAVPVTIGAGGTGGSGIAGGDGGDTSFGTLVVGGGGNGGTLGTSQLSTTINFVGNGGGGVGSLGSGVTGRTGSGGHGWPAFYQTSPLSGRGGFSVMGEGGFPTSGTGAGNVANSRGGGGSGGTAAASSGPAAGAAGAPGYLEVEEWSA